MEKIPTPEEVYNYYHRETFFNRNGVYPKTIKNFKSLYADDSKMEAIKYFIAFLQRNNASVDWKLYIKALALVLKNRFELKILGSFAGNKIYRDYVASLQIYKTDINEIYSDIVNSLQFLNVYIKENNITLPEYFLLDTELIPVSLKHIYAGTVSPYFYACFSVNILNQWFNYPDDVFYELFKMSKSEYIETQCNNKRNQLLLSPKTQLLVCQMEKKITKIF